MADDTSIQLKAAIDAVNQFSDAMRSLGVALARDLAPAVNAVAGAMRRMRAEEIRYHRRVRRAHGPTSIFSTGRLRVLMRERRTRILNRDFRRFDEELKRRWASPA